MPVPSLFELARQRLIKNIDMLNDVGDIPFSFLEPVLRFIQNPDQLQELEENCTQLLGETGDIWLRFIKRDIPDWNKKPHEPRDPRNWSKVYRKLKKDMEKEKQADADALKQQMQALQKDRAQNKTLIVDSRVGYGAGSSRMFTSRAHTTSWGAPTGAPPKTGKVAFDKLKRGIFDHKRERPKAQQMPAHVLAQRKTTIRQAPARMVRMAENEAPRSMVLSKQASASVAKKAEPLPSTARPQITQKPVPQQRSAPQRTSLPAGQQFSAPRLKPPTQESGAGSVPKRKREEYSLFHQPKRRKM
ncbi:RNA polymerase II transcription factor SIII subunit A-domain-containing protein [Pyrenochaeta sp. MPI-SDFR-AT-0127]|nr:RNA polymerase II transcription factor SIII subunit A-domain-containing protein [Pyrenochaeta sp. MPI-SDFR-AT-0127]